MENARQVLEKERDEARSKISDLEGRLMSETEKQEKTEQELSKAQQEKETAIGVKESKIKVRIDFEHSCCYRKPQLLLLRYAIVTQSNKTNPETLKPWLNALEDHS